MDEAGVAVATDDPLARAASAVRRRPVGLIMGLLVVGLVVRVLVVVATRHAPPLFDAGDYDRIGESLASGHGFGPSQWAAGPSAFRPPGYPVFLAGVFSVFGHSLLALRLVESVLGLASIAALGVIAFRVWNASAAVAVVAVAAVYLPLAVSSVSMVSEAIFVPLALSSIAVALHGCDRARSTAWFALAGFLAGLAWLTRSTGVVLLLPLLLLAAGLLRPSALRSASDRAKTARPHRLAAATAVLAAFVLAVVPWTIRNAIVMHTFVPVSTESYYTLASAYNNRSLHDPSQFYDPGTTSTYGRFFPEQGAFIRRSRLTETQVDSELHGPVLTFIRTHLSLVPTAVFAHLKRMVRATSDSEQPGYGKASVVAFYLLAVVFVLALFTRDARAAPAWLWLTGILMLLPVAFAATTPRFRAPFDPFLILVAGAGISAAAARALGRTHSEAPG